MKKFWALVTPVCPTKITGLCKHAAKGESEWKSPRKKNLTNPIEISEILQRKSKKQALLFSMADLFIQWIALRIFIRDRHPSLLIGKFIRADELFDGCFCRYLPVWSVEQVYYLREARRTSKNIAFLLIFSNCVFWHSCNPKSNEMKPVHITAFRWQ